MRMGTRMRITMEKLNIGRHAVRWELYRARLLVRFLRGTVMIWSCVPIAQHTSARVSCEGRLITCMPGEEELLELCSVLLWSMDPSR
jgi:hypothetical protein